MLKTKDRGEKKFQEKGVHSTDLTHYTCSFLLHSGVQRRRVSFPLHNRVSFSPWTAWMNEPFANYVKDDEARGKKCKARVPCT
jgi:hypothetical protein